MALRLPDNPTPPRRPASASKALRYAGAIVVALAVNAAVAAMLAGLGAPAGPGAESAPPAMPLHLLKTPPAPAVPREIQSANTPPQASPPAMPPALPTPPLATPEPTPPQIPTPELPPLHAARDSLRVPDFAAKTPPPAPAPVAPAPARAGPPAPAARAAAPARPSGTGGVDRGPVCLEPPDLSAYYPRRARLRGTTGQTTLRLTIDAGGNVTEAHVVQSTPEGVFDTAGRRVARTLRFLPARRAGKPVPVTTSLNLVWRLE